MNTRQIGRRIENLEVELRSSASKRHIDPFQAASPGELEKMVEEFKKICRSAEDKCGKSMDSWGSIERDPEEPTDLRLRARFWARRAVTAAINIMTWGNRART